MVTLPVPMCTKKADMMPAVSIHCLCDMFDVAKIGVSEITTKQINEKF
jgi:hypothetical protein